jgi:hypothetical protein
VKRQKRRKLKWKRLKALPGANNGCLCCPPIEAIFPMRDRIAVGFGIAEVQRDGETVWRETPNIPFEKCWTGRKAENRAMKSPNHDWRIIMDAPLAGRTYQRHGKNMWVLVEKNLGFA